MGNTTAEPASSIASGIIACATSQHGAVAWFPLAPGEAYWPAYTDDLAYVRQLNRGNVRDPE